MFRASNLLYNARIEKDLELPEISKKLKIPLKYLQALEAENIPCFPSEPYCSLIVKDYADFLGLNGKDILCVFRRDFDQRRKAKSSNKPFFSFTPRFTFIFSVVLFIFVFSFYLISEYIKFNNPPKLRVNWPSVLGESIEISGITDPDSTVTVNGDLVIVEQNGKFQKKLNVSSGNETKVRVESKSLSGKTTIDEKVLK